MRAKPNGGPAFPVTDFPIPGEDPRDFMAQNGMTLRQWYAGMYMQGGISKGPYRWDKFAEECFKAADAMIAHEKEEA